jgi:hypothetical protein
MILNILPGGLLVVHVHGVPLLPGVELDDDLVGEWEPLLQVLLDPGSHHHQLLHLGLELTLQPLFREPQLLVFLFNMWMINFVSASGSTPRQYPWPLGATGL